MRLQRFYLLGVGRTAPMGAIGSATPCTARVGTVRPGRSLAEPVPCGVERPRQRRAVGVDERQRVVLERVEVERILGEPQRVEVERAVRVKQLGDRHQWRAGDDTCAVAVGLVEQSRQGHHGAERMARRDQWQSRPFALGKFGQRIGEIRAVGDGAEIAAGARAEPVAELVDRPQVDSRGIEREAVPVVDAGVLAEAVQEDDDGARFLAAQ